MGWTLRQLSGQGLLCEPGGWRFSYGTIALWLCVQGGGRLWKGTMAAVCSSVWEEAVPQLSPWFQTLQSLPICHCAFLAATLVPELKGSESELNLCGGSLKGTSWDPEVFPLTQSPLVLQPEVRALEPLARGSGVGLGLLTPKISLPNFYPPYVSVGTVQSMSLHLHPFYQSGYM